MHRFYMDPVGLPLLLSSMIQQFSPSRRRVHKILGTIRIIQKPFHNLIDILRLFINIAGIVMEKTQKVSETLRSNENKLSKKQRRIVQKQLKLRNTLECHENIICCDRSTRVCRNVITQHVHMYLGLPLASIFVY